MIKHLTTIISAVTVRLCLITHCFLAVWRVVDIEGNHLFWLLALTNVLIIAEGIFRIIKRDGQESKWFSPCILFYLAGMVPAIWFLELDRLERYTEIIESSNITSEALSSINGVTLPIKLDADTWVSVLEQSMLFVFIISRWFLPRGRITRDQLSQLLFVYIGSGSDIMELFIVFEEPDVRSDLPFSYAILGVWTLSLFQFCLILTATRDITGRVFARETDLEGEVPEEIPEGEEKERMPTCCDRVFEVEIWSLFITMFLQDGPFLAVRLYAIIVKGVISYGILFFTAKNVLMLCLLIYRMVVICTKINSVDPEDNKPTPLKSRESTSKSSRGPDLNNRPRKQSVVTKVGETDKKPSKQSLISTANSSLTQSTYFE